MPHGSSRKTGMPAVRLRMVPIFWRYLLMMLCILLVAVAMVTINNKMNAATLQKSYLSQAQANLDRNCSELSQNLYLTYAIPKAIEGTTYYNYLRSENSGIMPFKFVSVLPYITKALKNQLYLQGKNLECVLYLSGTNSICTRKKVFVDADNCFDQYLVFGQSTKEDLLSCLRKKNNVALLPMQELTINGGEPQRCMAMVIRPVSSPISVMTIYSEETILSSIGVNELPEGTSLRIESEAGDVLEEWPGAASAQMPEKRLELRSSLSLQRASVAVWIPQSYFQEQLLPSYRIGVIMICCMAIAGFLLCVLLSRAAAQPIQKLVTAHGDRPAAGQYEVLALDGVLTRSKQRIDALQGMLLSNLLIRALSGAILSEEDERQLETHINRISPPYRVALVHFTLGEDGCLPLEQLQGALSGDCFCEAVNAKEIGILFPGDDRHIAALQGVLQQLPGGTEGCTCSVSGPFDSLPNIHIAVWQAHLAVPKEGKFAVYSGNAAQPSSFSWLQHERLYQTILSNDETHMVELLRQIARESYQDSAAREAFFNIRFVLRSAASEMDIPFQEVEETEYDAALLPRENIERLERLVHLLFLRIQEKQSTKTDTQQDQLIVWLQQNYSDCNLCAAMAAAKLGVSEKSVYGYVKRATGMSFNEYLLSLRMRRAAELLCSTRESVVEIAQQCGYQAESTFYRVFKKYYDHTPQQYRYGSSS